LITKKRLLNHQYYIYTENHNKKASFAQQSDKRTSFSPGKMAKGRLLEEKRRLLNVFYTKKDNKRAKLELGLGLGLGLALVL